MIWVLGGLGVVAVFGVVQLVHLSVMLLWGDQQTQGMRYFGQPAAERTRFKRRLQRHAVILAPIIRVMGSLTPFTFDKASFVAGGLAGPRGTCSENSFTRAYAYQPRSEDVFVVTQMKSGTTWMQHLVYQLLTGGQGDLVEKGSALYAVSPWLESTKSVAVDDAPLIGSTRPSRIIKTHLPASRCPFDPRAKYVYVVRHPVSCFASCVDFIGENTGPFAPPLEKVEEWFSSNAMWWGSWPAHVDGWWKRSMAHANVLFVSFEEMKADLTRVAMAVSALLEVEPLTDEWMRPAVEKCSFDYMSGHAEAFEMHPPHLLAVSAELFRRGTEKRYRDVPTDVRQRISQLCREGLRVSTFPLDQYYPDVLALASDMVGN